MYLLTKSRIALVLASATLLLTSCNQKLVTEAALDKLVITASQAPSQCHFVQKTEPYTLLPDKADPLVRLVFAFWFGDKEITDFKKGFSNIFQVEGQEDKVDQMITLGLLFVDEQSAKAHEAIVEEKYRYSQAQSIYREKNLLLLTSRRGSVSDSCINDYQKLLKSKIK